MTETQLVKLADELSTKSDRWLFIACLLVFFIGVYLVFRVVLRDRAIILTEYKDDRNLYRSSLEAIINEQHAVTNQMRVELAKHTQAILDNTRLLEKIWAKTNL